MTEESSYKVLSFDVGIKNLAYCKIEFSKETKTIIRIEEWGLINLKSDPWIPDHNEKRCMAEVKSGGVCGNCSNSWIIKNGARKELCRVHSKNYEKIQGASADFEFFPYELRDLSCSCGEKSRKFHTKISESMIRIFGYCNKCAKKTTEQLTKICDYMKSDDTKLYTNLYDGLNAIKIEDVNEVVIENQPALKNPRMKSIQMFIYSFFFIGGKNGRLSDLNQVAFFSATKKLNPTIIVEDILKKNKKELAPSLDPAPAPVQVMQIKEEPLSEYRAYKKRKNDSIFIVSCVLDEMDEWKKFFLSHPKKDDLADSLLQGIAQYSKLS
jgi:hypothetical protein